MRISPLAHSHLFRDCLLVLRKKRLGLFRSLRVELSPPANERKPLCKLERRSSTGWFPDRCLASIFLLPASAPTVSTSLPGQLNLTRQKNTLHIARYLFRKNGISVIFVSEGTKARTYEFSRGYDWRRWDSNPRPLHCERGLSP